MSPQLLEQVIRYSNEPVNGEYVITEPINRYKANGGVIAVLPASGKYLDGGSLEGWLEANNTVCK